MLIVFQQRITAYNANGAILCCIVTGPKNLTKKYASTFVPKSRPVTPQEPHAKFLDIDVRLQKANGQTQEARMQIAFQQQHVCMQISDVYFGTKDDSRALLHPNTLSEQYAIFLGDKLPVHHRLTYFPI